MAEAPSDPVSKEELIDLVEEIDEIRGRHTELVTVLIPAGYNINTVVTQLESEKSTASNIKSTATRKNVVEALEKIVRHLRLLGRTPKNGIAMFAGNISQIEGQEDMKMWSIEPPEELATRLYRCDQVFVVDPLKDMLKAKKVYALLVIDRKEATIGILEGKKIKILHKMESGVPGKIRAGGQSAARYSRIIENKAKEFFKKVSIAMKDEFFDRKDLKGILVGGPMPTKDDWLKDGGLVTALRNKVLGMVDLGYSDAHGIDLLVEGSQEILAEEEITKEKKLMEDFFNMLGKKKELTAYGLEPVKKALNLGAVDKLFISKNLPKIEIKDLTKQAEDMGTGVELISMDTEEGEQFFNLSGVGAILRYAAEL